MEQAYEVHRRDGRLPASYEVVHGHAWAPEQLLPEQLLVEDGVAIPLSAIRRGMG
jgi:malonyl-CoA O-methyltransferase